MVIVFVCFDTSIAFLIEFPEKVLRFSIISGMVG
ncbi:uncharacterized protein METZ01_LOCUS267514 [marine metagenome]|uniref:Uncharacterized protein n=1 Tax=marine metagenome TaxID=408172 RepID=A0A382JRC7_9ZZZZ